MSEVVSNESVEEVTPELESEGQVTEAIEEIESLSEQEIEMLPVDEFGEKYVSVQVNGEEVQVPLKEALSGYQRQADYTRKTQELSEQKRQVQFGAALQEALQNDPNGTLRICFHNIMAQYKNLPKRKKCIWTLLKSNIELLDQRDSGF
jgi:type II secretory pathway component PulF